MSKPLCKYGSSCYQTNPYHLKKYSHDINESSSSSSKSILSKRKKKHFSSDNNENPKKKTCYTSSDSSNNNEDCKFGCYCYRYNKEHRKLFNHPKKTIQSLLKGNIDNIDDIIDSSDSSESNSDIDIELSSSNELELSNNDENEEDKLPKPLNYLKDGNTTTVTSSTSSSVYTLKRTGNQYHCTCMAWKNQKVAPAFRTCKHLREYLGEKHEKVRCAKGNEELPAIPKTKATLPILLAVEWKPEINPTGWLISEKYDGVRAYWTGKNLLSRNGNEFPAPTWFIKLLPQDKELDGELWNARGKFQTTVSIVKTKGDKRWKTVKYMLFDIPTLQKPFSERYKELKKLCVNIDSEHIKCVKHSPCKDVDSLHKLLTKTEEKGGEGLMLRNPKSLYEKKRTSNLLKVKSFFDAEGKVIGYQTGKGKHKGRIGALNVIMECGKTFKIGSGLTDEQRTNPPKIGTIVTYRFRGYTNDGIPRFPTFVGERIDLNKPKDHK